MGKIIAIASHKGGVGKTTIALNLGMGLAQQGRRVLLIDADPQGALTLGCNLHRITRKGLVHFLRGEVEASEITIQAGHRPLFIVGTGVEHLNDLSYLQKESDAGRLGGAIKELAMGFDYILLDTQTGLHPALPHLFAVIDSLFLLCSCQASAIKTFPLYLQWIQKGRAEYNRDLILEGLLLTMVEENDRCDTEVRHEIMQSFPSEIFFKTLIPRLSSFARAALHSVPVAMLSQAPLANQAIDALVQEFTDRQRINRSASL